MEYPSLEAALGVIVFGPETETLPGIQFAAVKLREAAALLEYRYAMGRRQEQQQAQDAGQPDTAQHGQQLAPAKRKRQHRKTRGTTNGAAHTNEQQPPLPGTPEPNFDHAMEP
jgi:hypothetical protein